MPRHRVARWVAALALAAVPVASLSACSSRSRGGTYGSDAGSTVLSTVAKLSPETTTLEVNQTVKLSPVLIQKVRDASGKLWTHSYNDISKFNWSVLESGGGTIEPDGTSGMRKVYRAPGSAGVYHVQIAYTQDPGVTATSTLTVTAQPPCPTDYQGADGTACTEQGRTCESGDCANKSCLFSYADAGSAPPTCSELRCLSGKWHYEKFWLDPTCANPDAGDGGSTDASTSDADAANGDAAADASDSGLDGS